MSAQTDDIVEQNEQEPAAEVEGLPALVVYTRSYLARVKGGQLGSIPAMTGLIVRP
jgi:D-xylose transport system permease protein